MFGCSAADGIVSGNGRACLRREVKELVADWLTLAGGGVAAEAGVQVRLMKLICTLAPFFNDVEF